MRPAYEQTKTMWCGKGIDGKWYIGSLATEGDKKFIVDWKGKHEVIIKSITTA